MHISGTRQLQSFRDVDLNEIIRSFSTRPHLDAISQIFYSDARKIKEQLLNERKIKVKESLIKLKDMSDVDISMLLVGGDHNNLSDIKTNNINTDVHIRSIEDRIKLVIEWKLYEQTVDYYVGEYLKDINTLLDKIKGKRAVYDDDGNILTGVASYRKRLDLYEIDYRQIYEPGYNRFLQTIRTNLLADTVSIPENIEDARAHYSNQLNIESRAKRDWIVGGTVTIDTHSIPEQSAAVKKVETARQRGLRGLSRAATLLEMQTAYNAASTAIDAVTVVNAPIWKTDAGSSLTLTNGRHIINYTSPFSTVAYRADNTVIDEEDAPSFGDVAIDRTSVTEAFVLSYGPPLGTIRSSHGAKISYSSAKSPRAGNHDIVLTARNEYGPAALKVRIVVPDVQPSFVNANLAAKTLPSGTYTTVQFDEATGGNGILRYEINGVPYGMSFYPDMRKIEGRPRTAHVAENYIITATDEDGDTATQTVAITVT